MPKAVALIIDWEKQQIVASEFHSGPKCVVECQRAITAIHNDFPACLKTVLWNKAAQPYAGLEGLKALGMTEGKTDEELIKMLQEEMQ